MRGMRSSALAPICRLRIMRSGALRMRMMGLPEAAIRWFLLLRTGHRHRHHHHLGSNHRTHHRHHQAHVVPLHHHHRHLEPSRLATCNEPLTTCSEPLTTCSEPWTASGGSLGRMATQTLGGPGLGGSPILGARTLCDSFCLSFLEPHPYILKFSRPRSLLDSVEA